MIPCSSAEVMVFLFSLGELPVEASAIVAVAGRNCDMNTDLVTVILQPIELHLRVKSLAVTGESQLIISYESTSTIDFSCLDNENFFD